MNQVTKFLTCLICIFSIQHMNTSAQFWKKKRNQYINGIPEGYWIAYIDSTKKQVEYHGRYKHGHEKGKWKYYYENGKLRKKERFGKNLIRTKYYYESGRRKSSGNAILVYEGESLHYYYQGKWKYFNEEGKLSSIVFYERGEELKTIKYDFTK